MTKTLKFIFALGALLVTACSTTNPPTTPKPGLTPGVQLRGLNRAGAEYGDDWDGWTGQTYYEWPSASVRALELSYYKGKGVNCVRLPISWERLQHTLNGPLDPAYQASLLAYVNDATSKGLTVVVDLHNYGRYATGAYNSSGQQVGTYTRHVLGDGALTFDHVADVWRKLAPLFAGNQLVVFNLMNEQHDADASLNSTAVFAGYQKVLDAVRSTGAKQLVLFPNTRSSDAHHWGTWSPQGGPLDSSAALSVADGAGNLAFDVHSYQGIDVWNDDVAAMTAWARANGKRLFLSEVGTTSGPAAVSSLLTHLNANSDVWVGWTTWNLDPYTIMVTNAAAGTVADTQKMAWYAPFLNVASAPPPCSYTYSAWSACQPNGTQTRAVASSSPAGCVGTPTLSQTCAYAPLDTDGDGVADASDACPKAKGVKTNDPRSNGCLPLEVSAVKTYDWGSGFCKQYSFKNPNPVPMAWKSATFYLNDNKLRGPDAVWGANFPNAWATGTVVVTPTASTAVVQPGQTLPTVGFCADRGPSGYTALSGPMTY